MIKSKNILIGHISGKGNLSGKLSNAILKPETEELKITPSATEQVQEGLYRKVTVVGDENLVANNIKEGTSIFGVEGIMVGGWDSSQITSCKGMFAYNKEMINAPYFDTRNAKNMAEMFLYCESLETVPIYNTSNSENLSYMFKNCRKLISANFDDTSKVTNTAYMFYNCDDVTSVSFKDTSNVTKMDSMFGFCYSLKTAPELNTSNVINFSGMFSWDGEMENAPMYDTSKAVNISDMFNKCVKLINVEGLLNLGQGYTQQKSNYYNYKLSLSTSEKLTHDSLMNIINNLYDLNLTYDVANGGTLYTQGLSLGSKNIAKLTPEEIAIATNKGWTVS